MQLGFVSAILPDFSLADLLAFASDEGFSCVEVMCWPPGKAERRYAGVTHIDVTSLNDDEIGRIKEQQIKTGVGISALGYYPNYLEPGEHARGYLDHFKMVISAAPRLGIDIVTTFIGRDPNKSVGDNWPLVQTVWPEIIQHAKNQNVRIGIENCPMLFSQDEWPGGKNLAMSPQTWRQMFEMFPGNTLGLNFDPSHLLWLQIDCVRAIKEFGSKIYHAHAKDTKIDLDNLYEVGVMGLGWNIPKIPGLGDVHWGKYFSALSDVGYDGPVCIEVEDRAFEGSLEDRKRSLRQSRKFLEQFVS